MYKASAETLLSKVISWTIDLIDCFCSLRYLRSGEIRWSTYEDKGEKIEYSDHGCKDVYRDIEETSHSYYLSPGDIGALKSEILQEDRTSKREQAELQAQRDLESRREQVQQDEITDWLTRNGIGN